MADQIIYAGVTLDEFTDRVAEKVFQKMNWKTDTQIPTKSSSEDILFKSLQEAADYYGVCYQTFSKHLDKIDHIPFGRSIKVYKSAIETAIRKHGILSKKGGRK
jgi:hypothetical protein